MTGRLRLGSDIGGTFTDLILASEDGSTFEIGKVLTTPEAPDDAVVAGGGQVIAAAGARGADVGHVIHGTTLFTNALIERKGARTALITTKGFRDALEIAREHRYDMYDLRLKRPPPLAPRYLRFEVDERVLVDGTVERPLDEASVRALLPLLEAERIEALGICLLHSYVNDAHERRVAEIVSAALPHLAITVSSELVPEIREYDRTSTTLANVYVKRIAERYLGRLQKRLTDEQHIAGALYVMQSNGGVSRIEEATRYPVRLVESGPAAGALAAAYYGALTGHPDLLSFDMGGTTAKACIIDKGEPLIAPEFEVAREYQFKKGSGLPVKVSVIEMIEIGTGGGSIARVDGLKRLQVGPQSAGAKPGPVCYGQGGTEPTVTDADLALGYLDPAFFLGGKMRLDVEGSRRAVAEKVGGPLGLAGTEAAWGIHQLANEAMASAARIHAIERGKDASRLPIFAFGGAGPVHAYGVARILRSSRVIYPLGAGVMSAIGMLTAPLAFDFVRTFPGGLDSMDWAGVARVVEGMEAEGREILSHSVPPADIRFQRYADMRYRKQGYDVRVPIPSGKLGPDSHHEIRRRFEEVFERLYGHVIPNTPIDVLSWRVIALGPKPSLVLPKGQNAGGGTEAAVKGKRSIYLPASRGFADVPVYDRYLLAPGSRLEGPAIVEERESTVVVNGPARIHVDDWSNLVVDVGAA
ncbi:MAG: hydantoinase/oxoprolinase family protein [Hyphomicrobiaceae bacterium]